MKLTKKESIEAGLKLWQWLADNPGKLKDDYFQDKKGEKPESGCYACQYVRDMVGAEYCDKCRTVCYLWDLWGGRFCICNDTVYSQWLDAIDAHDMKSASECAKKIADYHKKLLEEIE